MQAPTAGRADEVSCVMRFLRQSLTGLFLVSVTLGLMTYAGAMIYTEVEARLSE